MSVQREGGCNSQKPHGFKTHTINKTLLFSHSGQHDSHCGMMRSIVNPFNPENGNNRARWVDKIVYPFQIVRPAASRGIASPSGMRGASGNRRTYSSKGITANAGLPSCMMVWMLAGVPITLLNHLNRNDSNAILDIEQDTRVADFHPVSVFVARQNVILF